MSGERWAKLEDGVQHAVTNAIERATLTVLALRKVTTKALTEECCEDATSMFEVMFDL